MGTRLRILSENYLMSTNMTDGFQNLCSLVLWRKVAVSIRRVKLFNL